MDSLIAPKNKPVSGITQPDNGADYAISFSVMGRRRKIVLETDTPDSIMRRKIEARLNIMFPRATGGTQQYEMLSKVADVGAETIRAFMVGERSPTLKNIMKVAEAVGLTLPELFTKEITKGSVVDESEQAYLQRR